MRQNVREIGIDRISPNLFTIHEVETIEEMAMSIRYHGQTEPIQVWFAGEDFRILDGEKRWRACKKLGVGTIKAVIV
jgi:ParB family transcriptional regulator, chromosome partitioning protein